MLKLLKYEWETKLKKSLTLWVPVLIGIYAIMRVVPVEGLLDLVSKLAPMMDRERILFYLTDMIPMMVFFFCAIQLGGTGQSILWKEAMKGGYLLHTMPELASKIVAAKLLASLPLIVITALLFSLLLEFEVFAWWLLVPFSYTAIMLILFIYVLKRTVLIGKWYAGWVFPIGLLVGIRVLFFFRITAILTQTVHLVLLLVGMSTILFFISTYLLENKLDVWE